MKHRKGSCISRTPNFQAWFREKNKSEKHSCQWKKVDRLFTDFNNKFDEIYCCVFAATLVSCSSMHSSLLGWKKNIRTSLGQVMYKVTISIKQHGNLFRISCVWMSSVGEKLVAKQEFNNPMDKHAVRVVKGDKTVSHFPCEFCQIAWYFLGHLKCQSYQLQTTL